MARSINLLSRTTRARRFAPIALASTALMTPGVAWADCVPSGSTVTCSGTSAAYTNTASGVNVSVASGATVTAPLVIGTSGTLTNAGTVTNTGAIYGVQYNDNATITNNGTITSTSSTSGAGAISVGANSTVTNNGVLTAYSGTPAVTFGVNGTFINNAAATAAVTGNIVYGTNTDGNRAYFYNYNTTYGFTGAVTASGSITAVNTGIFTGTFSQSPVSATVGTNTVSFTNGLGGTFTGVFATGDQTTLNNAGTMYLYNGSTVGYYYTSGGTSTLNNNNTTANADGTITNSQLWIGTSTAPAQVKVYGNFVQGANGTLNIPIYPAGSATTAAGTNYSQLYTTGSVTLNGTLNLNVTAGFYPTGTLFNVVHADGTITNNATFTVNNGTNLLFTTFTSLGVQPSTTGTGSDYRVAATHNSYDTVMAANGANANQIAISKALGHTDGTITGTTGLLATATASTGSDAATLLGTVDILSAPDAKVFLDTISPEGYLAYATALRDQANLFHRTIDMRLKDQNSDHPEDGWWLTPMGQGSFSSTASTVGGYRTRDQITAIAAGYDFSGPNHVYGLAVNLSWNKLKYALANLNGTNRDYAVAAYVGKNFGPLHLTGVASYHMGKMTTTKLITIGAYSRTAGGSAGEDLFKATAKAGFELKTNGWTAEPFVGIDFNKGKIKGFTETGAGAANLSVNGISADRTEWLAGLSLTRSKGMLRPYLTATYRSKITGAGNTVTALMNGQADTQFTVTGLAQSNSQVDTNAGVNFVFDDAGALFIGYQGTYRGSYMAHGINLGIRLEF